MFGIKIAAVVCILFSGTATQLLPSAPDFTLLDFTEQNNNNNDNNDNSFLFNVPDETVTAAPDCSQQVARAANIGFNTNDPCQIWQPIVANPVENNNNNPNNNNNNDQGDDAPATPSLEQSAFKSPLTITLPPLQLQTMEVAEQEKSEEQFVTTQSNYNSGWWQPTPGLSWQYQLQGRIDMGVEVDVFVLNLFQIDDSIVSQLQETGAKVICYFSAGVYEDWNSDALDYPQRILGKPVKGWPGERWIDIRLKQKVKPLMAARLDRAKNKNCDGVLLDHLDAYDQDTGFALAEADQLTHNNWLAKAAHERGLTVGFQNAAQLIYKLESDFDFAVSENCNALDNCQNYRILIENNKAVFAVEYSPDFLPELTWQEITDLCTPANQAGLSGIVKNKDLFETRIPCTP